MPVLWQDCWQSVDDIGAVYMRNCHLFVLVFCDIDQWKMSKPMRFIVGIVGLTIFGAAVYGILWLIGRCILWLMEI